MGKAKYHIEFIKRPLSISRKQFEYDESEREFVTVEGYNLTDALREFAIRQADFMEEGIVADIVAVRLQED